MKKNKERIREKTPDIISRKKADKKKTPIGSLPENLSTINMLKDKRSSIQIKKPKIASKNDINKSTIEPKKDNKTNNPKNTHNNINNDEKIQKIKKTSTKKIANYQIRNKDKKQDNNDNKNIMNKTTESFYKPKPNQLKKNINTGNNNNNKTFINTNNFDTEEIKRKGTFDIRISQKKRVQKKENLKDKSVDKIPKNNIDNSLIKRQVTMVNAENKNKRNIICKTPDTGKVRKPRNKMPPNLKNKNKDITTKKKPQAGNTDNKSVVNTNTNTKRNSKTNITTVDNKTNENKPVINKEIKYNKIRNKTYESNYMECLYLALRSGFFNPNKKLNIIINSKELYKNIDKKKMIKELIDYYEKIGNDNIIKNNSNKKYDIKKINDPFKPTEKSINALNFLDKEEEQKLINEIQHPYINELFKVLLILLNELNEYKNNNKENKNIFEFFFVDVLQKYKVNNIKKLMINNFVNTSFVINDEQFELIQKILKLKSDLFSPATMLRYNRALAYFIFFMKELYAYLNLKTEDGQYYFKIRANLPKNEYQEKIDNLKLLL
jgi:hypothetical protein